MKKKEINDFEKHLAGGWPEKREKRKESETHFSELTYTTTIAKKIKKERGMSFAILQSYFHTY